MPLWSLVVSCLVLPTPAALDEWPAWRGPARTNLSTESEWSSIGAEAPLWRADVGVGYSTPIVAGGRVFCVGYRASESDPNVGRDEVVALDATSGEKLWSFDYPSRAFANEHRGGVIGTPVTAEGALFVATRQGELRALATDSGELLWSVDLAARHNVEPGRYGFASSPFIDGERLVVCMASAIALDRRTGETLWVSENLDANYSTVATIELPGTDGAGAPQAAYVAFGGRGVFALDAVSGQTLRHCVFRKTPRNVEGATPIVTGTDVFVSSGYEQGGACIDMAAEPPVERWRSRTMRTKLAGATLFRGAYFGHDESMLACVGADGTLRWRERGLGQGALSIAGERMLLTTSEGELVVAAASQEGFQELSRRKVIDDGDFWATPVISRGLVYVRGSLGDLVCLDHRRRTEGVATVEAPAAQPDANIDPSALEANYLRLAGLSSLANDGLSFAGTLHVVALGIEDSPATWQWGPSGVWHSSFDLPPGIGGTIHEAFDGARAWKIDPYRGNQRREGAALAELIVTRGMGSLVDPLPEGLPARYAGRESFRGLACHRVEVTLPQPAGAEAQPRPAPRIRSVFFEVATGRYVGRTASEELTLFLDDWREVDGGWLPFRRTEFEPESGLERRFAFTTVRRVGPTVEDTTIPPDLIDRDESNQR